MGRMAWAPIDRTTARYTARNVEAEAMVTVDTDRCFEIREETLSLVDQETGEPTDLDALDGDTISELYEGLRDDAASKL